MNSFCALVIEFAALFVTSVVEWFVCLITVREGVGLSPTETKVVILVYNQLGSPVTKQGFVLVSDDHHIRMLCRLIVL